MTVREKMLAVFRRTNNHGIPFAAYEFLLPRGYQERRIREKGCGILRFERLYLVEMRGVEVCISDGVENGYRFIRRRFSTPLGSVEERILIDSSYGSQWTKDFLVKDPRDYGVLRYMVENSVYYPNYDLFWQVENDLGEDGVVFANVDRTPFQKLLLDWVGPERLFVDLFEIPNVVEDLLNSMAERAMEIYRLMADSPAFIIHTWDNVTEDFTSPHFFAQYCLPFYQRVGDLLRAKGKLFAVHLDGKLKNLSNLIAQAPIDVVESFTLPEAGGNLTLEEAQKIWPDKAIVANLPACLCLEKEEAVREYLEELLSRADQKRFMVCLSEDLPRDSWQSVLDVAVSVFCRN